MAQDLPGMAAGVLQQTNLARQAISAHEKSAALDHVRQGLTLTTQIQQASGPERPLLVAVSKEIDTTTTYRPVKHRKSDEMNADRLKKNTSVREVEGTVTTSKLDVTSAADHLQTAQSALERDDWTAADSALAAIPGTMVQSSGNTYMPLMKAKENLQLARARVLDGKPKDAAAPLRAAAEALADWERQAPGPHTQEAESMRQSMLAYANNIHKDHADAVERITSWLTPVEQWNQAVVK
jgi:hypothetical protein